MGRVGLVLLRKTTILILQLKFPSYFALIQYYFCTKLVGLGFFIYTARELVMHTTLEHYLKQKTSSVSSWQQAHEIHTLLANTE